MSTSIEWYVRQEEKIAAATGRARQRMASTGHVYVVAFWSGAIKVGKTTVPKQRLRSHERRAEIHGDGVEKSWVSRRHPGYDAVEQLLIKFCIGRGTPVNSREYFRNLDYAEVQRYAELLSDADARDAYLKQLVEAVGGNLAATWEEAERALRGEPPPEE